MTLQEFLLAIAFKKCKSNVTFYLRDCVKTSLYPLIPPESDYMIAQ
jgi:hypothetical protein